MSGVLKEGAQLDAVLQGQSLSKEDSGSRDTSPNTRPGNPLAIYLFPYFKKNIKNIKKDSEIFKTVK